jgi:putative endonuclease
MPLNKIKIGQQAEQIAAKYLITQGHELLYQNFKTSYGEIDIITKFHNYICLVEVKYTTVAFLNPYHKWTKRQKRKLRNTFNYSNLNSQYSDKEVHIIFIWIALGPRNELKLKWILDEIDFDYD